MKKETFESIVFSAPFYYLNLNLNPNDCIVVEDALSGIDSARAANIGKIIAIASIESDSLYHAIPYVDRVIHDFHELLKSEIFD